MQARLSSCARPAGFTLVELMAMMAIISIVMAIAAPGLAAFSSAQRLRDASSDLVTTLLAARSEAIKRNAEVTVSAAVVDGGVNWGRGWTATAGGRQIDRKEAADAQIDGSTTPATIVFDGSGRVTAGGGVSIQLNDSHADGTVAPRCIAIDLVGRPQASVGSCS